MTFANIPCAGISTLATERTVGGVQLRQQQASETRERGTGETERVGGERLPRMPGGLGPAGGEETPDTDDLPSHTHGCQHPARRHGEPEATHDVQ